MMNRFHCCSGYFGDMDDVPTPYSQNSQATYDDVSIPLPPVMGRQMENAQAASREAVTLPEIAEPDIIIPDANTPVTLPEIAENPNISGCNRPGCNIPIIPLPPIIINPPSNITPQRFCRVRFLHAAPNSGPVNISIGMQRVATNLSFGNFSEYTYVQDGFRPVTVMNTRTPRVVLLQRNVAFLGGDVITIAILNTYNGIELNPVNDKSCNNRPAGMSCLRMANFIYNGSPIDLMLNDGRVVFSDVRSRETTTFTRIRQGNYGMYIAYTPNQAVPHVRDVDTLDEMPMAVSERFVPGYGDMNTIVAFLLSVKRNTMYTIYVVGDADNPADIQTIVAENY